MIDKIEFLREYYGGANNELALSIKVPSYETCSTKAFLQRTVAGTVIELAVIALLSKSEYVDVLDNHKVILENGEPYQNLDRTSDCVISDNLGDYFVEIKNRKQAVLFFDEAIEKAKRENADILILTDWYNNEAYQIVLDTEECYKLNWDIKAAHDWILEHLYSLTWDMILEGKCFE